MVIEVGAQHDGSQRPHEESGAEGHEGKHYGHELVAAREEGYGNRSGIIAKHLEVVHLQEIAARHAHHRPELQFLTLKRTYRRFRYRNHLSTRMRTHWRNKREAFLL